MNVRRQWKSLKWIAAVVCGMAMTTTASRGAVVYQYVADQPAYTTNTAGSFVNVLVYLKETLTNGSTSLITSDGGLFGGAMTLARNATGLPANPSSFLTDSSGFTPNLTDFGGHINREMRNLHCLFAVPGVNGG